MALDTATSAPARAPASETQTLLGISAAHLVSHIYILAVPVLLPLFKVELGV